MKNRILAILGLIAYIMFIIWFTIKDLPPKGELPKETAEKISVEAAENAAEE